MDNFAVVLDACVLYPAPLRDLLLRIAVSGLYRARWTERIHDEWTRNLLANNPKIDPDRLKVTRERMNKHAEGCIVEDYEILIPSITLPDEDDRHVVAAAIASKSSVIVTYNLKDFPTSALRPLGIEAQHPDDFLLCQMDLNLTVVCKAIRQMREAMKNPPMDAEQLLEVLLKRELPATVGRLRDFVSLL